MARYLGLDLGTRTLGFSMSDETGMIANAYKTIRYPEGKVEVLLEEVEKIVLEYQIETVVLGFPKNMNNTVGESGERAIQFQKKLSDYLKMDVILQDERLSTVEALNYLIAADMSRKKERKKVDSVAANIILQAYLDRKRNI